MLINEVTKKSEQIARSIEGYWVALLLVGILTLFSWVAVFIDSFTALYVAVPATLLFVNVWITLRGLYSLRKKFEKSPSEYSRVQVPEPFFISMLTNFYHK